MVPLPIIFRLKRMAVIRHRPSVLRPAGIIFGLRFADQATLECFPKQLAGSGTFKDANVITEGFFPSRRSGRLQPEITRVAFVMGMPCIFDFLGKQVVMLPLLLKLFHRQNASMSRFIPGYSLRPSGHCSTLRCRFKGEPFNYLSLFSL